jgi:hypothetical protein
LGPVGADPDVSGDRFSASYLVALAARSLREVGMLWRGARAADKRLATLSIDTTIRFASPAARAAFTADLTAAVAPLTARYHDKQAPAGRAHRLVVAAYPAPPDKERKSDADEI